MIRTAVCFTVLMAAASVRGDIPLPPNLQYVDPVVKFEGVAKLSDYEFRLRFTSFTGAPTGVYRYLAVPEGKAFNLKAERRLGPIQLLGLKRDAFERREKEDPTLQWLTDETPGVLAADVPTPPTTGPAKQPVPVSSYRVRMKDDKLIVEAVDAPKDEKKVGAAPRWSTWVSGIALSLACGGFGLWAVRNGRTARRS